MINKVALALPVVLTFAGAVSVWGQSAISARSGMIHYVEGKVLLDGQPVETKFAEFPQVKNDQVLSTEEGRAEVLLTPGVFLRVAENSSFRMVSNQLADTAIEVTSGQALLEVDDLLKDNSISVKFLGSNTELDKKGLYLFDAAHQWIRVYDGELTAVIGGERVTAHKNKQIEFGAGDKLQAKSFDSKDSDPFYRWAERRSEYIATANVSAARQAGTLGLLSGGSYGSWAWNPWYGMFTFLPTIGYGYSPFGWAYYSPFTVAPVFLYSNYNGYGGSYAPNAGYSNSRIPTLTRSGSASMGTGSGGIVAPARAESGFGQGGISAPMSAGGAAPSMGAGGGAAPISVGGGGGGAVSAGGGGHGASVGGGGAHR